MKFKIGKKMLLLLTLILAVVCTSIGIATATEVTPEVGDIRLISDSEIVVCKSTTLSGAPNTYKTEGAAPEVQKFDGEKWVNISNTELTWTSATAFAASVRSDGVVPYVSDGSYSSVITGTLKTDGTKTVSYTVYPSFPIASKADIDLLTSKANDVGAWQSMRNYALVADIDYMSETWHERYLKPIGLTTYRKSGDNTFSGIFGSIPAWTDANLQFFNARFDGQGFSIKNAVLALGSAFRKDVNNGTIGYGQNWISNLYGGRLLNIKFDNLIFESAADAIAHPEMYTVDTNSVLEGRYVDKNPVDGKDDTTGIPVVVGGDGEVTAINVSALSKNRTWSDETVQSTLAQGVGLVGYMANGAIIDNVYLDADIHTAAMYYSSEQLPSGVLVSEIASGASKISNCVIVPNLTEGRFSSASGGGSTVSARDNYYKYIGAIAGENKNATTVTDTISNCAVLLESDSGLKTLNTFNAYVGIQVYAGRYYNMSGNPYNANTIDTHGLTNVKIYEASGSASALSQMKADTTVDTTVFAKHSYWHMPVVIDSIFQGEYDSAPEGDVDYATIVFGQLNLGFIESSDIVEFGIELKRWTPSAGRTLTYELRFNDEGDKELSSENRFGIAFYDLPMTDTDDSTPDDYKACIYVKLNNGTVIKSGEINFTVAQ